MSWIKSSKSNPSGNCVALSKLHTQPPKVGLRNTNTPSHIMTFTPDEIDAFIRGVKAGEFDRFLLEDK